MQQSQKIKKMTLSHIHKKRAVSNFLTFLRLSIIHQLNNELFRKSIQFTGEKGGNITVLQMGCIEKTKNKNICEKKIVLQRSVALW